MQRFAVSRVPTAEPRFADADDQPRNRLELSWSELNLNGELLLLVLGLLWGERLIAVALRTPMGAWVRNVGEKGGRGSIVEPKIKRLDRR